MRLPDWQPRLIATVDAWRVRPFQYGSADCLQFLAECVLAVRGTDYRERFPMYDSPLAAARILRRAGGLQGLITSVLGPPKPIAEARAGDAIAGQFAKELTAGVSTGVVGWATGPDGLYRVPLEMASFAWSV